MTRHLITSALPYINGIKHLGNLAGSMLPADVYARHLRQQGEAVLYICGTDEHGTPAELAANNAGISVEAYCTDMYARQKAIYEAYAISFDYFGRSSDPENHTLTQNIFQDLDQKGWIQDRASSQIYSHADQRFLPDRYVTGECPHCHDPKARGDQCDGCGKLLTPTELLHPHSAISQSDDVEIQTTHHLYLSLNQLSERCQQWLDTVSPNWPVVSRGIAHKWMQEGLQPRCISRDLDWGIPIPKAGFENKVFYVWFDAPNAYISMTMAWSQTQPNPEAWRAWWQPENPEDVQYTQFMAKDNVPFHAVFWPAMLLGTGQPWKQVDVIKAVNWLNYDGGKFSTSQQRGIFMDEAIERFPADYWRYYLMSILPESSDADFKFEHFAQTINKDLADTLGNFAGRVTALLDKYCEGQVPDLQDRNLPAALLASLEEKLTQIDQLRREHQLLKANQMLKALWILGNEYIALQQPWSTVKTDPEAAKAVLWHCVVMLRCFAVASSAVMPHTASLLFEKLNQSADASQVPLAEACDLAALPVGHPITRCSALFEKITPEKIAELATHYQGAAS